MPKAADKAGYLKPGTTHFIHWTRSADSKSQGTNDKNKKCKEIKTVCFLLALIYLWLDMNIHTTTLNRITLYDSGIFLVLFSVSFSVLSQLLSLSTDTDLN